jgi:glycine/D-amino acid oxidase-like deaminating enzyme
MDLRSGHPYWLLKNGLMESYPALDHDVEAEVVVLGAGITGALVTYLLVKQGVNVVVVDKREAGWGSTSASTGLLQYEIDCNLFELKQLVGEADAIHAYRLGVEAIDAIGQVVGELAEEGGAKDAFQRRPSLYAARRLRDERVLEQEFEARQACGLRVRYLTQHPLIDEFGVKARAAIVSEDAAQIDPYLAAHRLLARSVKLGAQVYDRTEVTKISAKAQGVLLTTDRGFKLSAKKLVFASGYETQNYLKQPVAELHSTYALVSEPVSEHLRESETWVNHLLWEAARPYFYLRTTDDGRLIMGGEDEPFRDADKRDRLIGRKTAKLLKTYAAFYPGRSVPEVAFAWAGTFGETKDGLAYIGESPEMPNAYFALGYGGNGITYSMIAARIIADLYRGIPNPDARFFRFDR